MRSPGRRVTNWLMPLTVAKQSYAIPEVLPRSRSVPFNLVAISNRWGSTSVSIHGPTGPKVSLPFLRRLDRSGDQEPSPLISFPQV